MLRQDFNGDWFFKKEDEDEVPVRLPHDFSILMKRDEHTPAKRGTGFFPGGVADYSKHLSVPKEYENKVVMLEFEGVYMNPTVRVNGDIAAKWHYGYTTFHCDLTPFLKYGEDNLIEVHVNNSLQPNSRWYTGSGIYRPVSLMIGEKLFVKPFGLCIVTPKVSKESAAVRISAELENRFDGEKSVKAVITIFDANGAEAAKKETEAVIGAGSTGTVAAEFDIDEPMLWSDETPNLYRAKAEIFTDGLLSDTAQTAFGIRSISFDPVNGFLLNGKKTMLRGGDVHHDCGILGARAFARAEERKAQLLKENGFNAVRCAHNPPSPAFLDACDRLGLLVMDEAFDCWREAKLENDYSLFFDDDWKKDLGAMILRDRNHPSVILWSTGNEIKERDGRSDGCEWAKRLAGFVRSMDDTRPVTNGVNEIANAREEFIDCLDVAGYNYELYRYEDDRCKYPGRVIIACENYIKETFDYWMEYGKYPNVAGDFYWTALDYLGEPGVGKPTYVGERWMAEFPWHFANCGDIDICGFKRPQSYYRDCVWKRSKKPYIAVFKPQHYGRERMALGWAWHDVLPSWDWPGFEGKPAAVQVYSEEEEVELFINGRSLGKKPAGLANKYIALYDTEFEPGEIKAVAYSNGEHRGETMLCTPKAAAKTVLRPDRTSIAADGDDLVFVEADLADEAGNLIYSDNRKVMFSVCGAGELIAVGSTDPLTDEMYVGNERRFYEGKVMAVIRSNGRKGNITLTAMCDGIPAAQTVIRAE